MSKESQNIEWKESWRDEYLKWICGFANAGGGTVILGKNDNGEVIGINNSKKLLEEIPNKIKDTLGIIVDVNLKNIDNKEVVEIKVEPYPYPINYKGEYHYRSGSTKQILKGLALDRFLLNKQGKTWDGVPIPNISVKDFDKKAIESFRHRAIKSQRLNSDILNENDDNLIEKLYLFESSYLKRASVLLFHPDPEKYISGSYIKIGYFKDNANLIYHDEIHGDLFEQTEKTVDLIYTKYLKGLISYEGIQRVETFPVPKEAFREALLNAIVHKDYSSNIPIQISIYDDKILIWNSGILPDGWTVKKLTEKHSSQPHNPNIANVFFKAGMIEAWGRGIEKIIESCKISGISSPLFKYENTGLWVEFYFTTQENPQETPKKITQEIILNLIKDNPEITRNEMSEKLNVTIDSIKYNLDKLKTQGIIKHIGPTKKGKWEILR